MNKKETKFIFLGTGPLAESALYSLFQNDLIPLLVITSPDKKSGRNLELQKNIIATWCESKNIKYIQPDKLTKEILEETLEKILEENNEENNFEKDFLKNIDLFIVASYPKILKEEILNIPKYGCINIHPSLLPKYRGPSPIQSALLNGDENIGISIMKIDKEVDHGEILIQKEIRIEDRDVNEKLERKCGAEGALMINDLLEHYLNGNLKLKEQDHDKATFTHKFEKKAGEINLKTTSTKELQNKFRALLPHIPIYFFINHKNKNEEKEIRIKITDIDLDKNNIENKSVKDIIKKVIPEGKSEMSFSDFEKGYLK